jgi:hypothetical protein
MITFLLLSAMGLLSSKTYTNLFKTGAKIE